jgi:hypothetical protein
MSKGLVTILSLGIWSRDSSSSSGLWWNLKQGKHLMSNRFALQGQKKELEKYTVLGDFTLNKGKFV